MANFLMLGIYVQCPFNLPGLGCLLHNSLWCSCALEQIYLVSSTAVDLLKYVLQGLLPRLVQAALDHAVSFAVEQPQLQGAAGFQKVAGSPGILLPL